MKDLDFDELDRAVNSLLTTNSVPEVEKPTDTPVVEQSSVNAEVVEPSPAAATTPLAARRTSGRFMDVVHPSSDMRTSYVPQRPVSRVGIGLSPFTSTPINTAAEAPQDAQPIETSTPDVPVIVDDTQKPSDGEWPDPLDFNGFSQNDAPVIPTDTKESQNDNDDDHDLDQIADAINQTLADESKEDSSPLESPFLMDAKVEKRPLGAFSVDTAAIQVEPVASTPPVQPIPSESVSSDEDVFSRGEDNPVNETPLPAELQDDLLSIESDTDTTGKLKKEEVVAPPQVVPSTTSAGPVSIAQQYTEQPNTGDQPTGAIFDTNAYQKPLAHPVKKKSGWLMVLWITLLLIIGAGAGAAAYFYVLPSL